MSEPLTKAEMIANWQAANTRITTAGQTFERRAKIKLARKNATGMFIVKSQVISKENLCTTGCATAEMYVGMADDFEDIPTLKAEDIKRAVCAVMGIVKNDLLGPYRLRQYVNARFIAYWFMRRHTMLSLPHIGRLMGDRHHATVMNGLAHIKRHPKKFEPWLSAVAARLGIEVSPYD